MGGEPRGRQTPDVALVAVPALSGCTVSLLPHRGRCSTPPPLASGLALVPQVTPAALPSRALREPETSRTRRRPVWPPGGQGAPANGRHSGRTASKVPGDHRRVPGERREGPLGPPHRGGRRYKPVSLRDVERRGPPLRGRGRLQHRGGSVPRRRTVMQRPRAAPCSVAGEGGPRGGRCGGNDRAGMAGTSDSSRGHMELRL